MVVSFSLEESIRDRIRYSWICLLKSLSFSANISMLQFSASIIDTNSCHSSPAFRRSLDCMDSRHRSMTGLTLSNVFSSLPGLDWLSIVLPLAYMATVATRLAQLFASCPRLSQELCQLVRACALQGLERCDRWFPRHYCGISGTDMI